MANVLFRNCLDDEYPVYPSFPSKKAETQAQAQVESDDDFLLGFWLKMYGPVDSRYKENTVLSYKCGDRDGILLELRPYPYNFGLQLFSKMDVDRRINITMDRLQPDQIAPLSWNPSNQLMYNHWYYVELIKQGRDLVLMVNQQLRAQQTLTEPLNFDGGIKIGQFNGLIQHLHLNPISAQDQLKHTPPTPPQQPQQPCRQPLQIWTSAATIIPNRRSSSQSDQTKGLPRGLPPTAAPKGVPTGVATTSPQRGGSLKTLLSPGNRYGHVSLSIDDSGKVTTDSPPGGTGTFPIKAVIQITQEEETPPSTSTSVSKLTTTSLPISIPFCSAPAAQAAAPAVPVAPATPVTPPGPTLIPTAMSSSPYCLALPPTSATSTTTTTHQVKKHHVKHVCPSRQKHQCPSIVNQSIKPEDLAKSVASEISKMPQFQTVKNSQLVDKLTREKNDLFYDPDIEDMDLDYRLSNMVDAGPTAANLPKLTPSQTPSQIRSQIGGCCWPIAIIIVTLILVIWILLIRPTGTSQVGASIARQSVEATSMVGGGLVSATSRAIKQVSSLFN